MPSPSKNVLEAALQLPESERLALVDRLLKMLPDDDYVISLDDDLVIEELMRHVADREEGSKTIFSPS